MKEWSKIKITLSVVFSFVVVLVIFFLLSKMDSTGVYVSVQTLDGTCDYKTKLSQSLFKNGENVFIVGPPFEMEIVPNDPEYMKIFIPEELLLTKKDTFFISEKIPKGVRNEIKIGKILKIYEKNIFGIKVL